MGMAQLTTFLALVSMPRAQAVWLGRLDPKQLLGPWYILAVASREKGFVLEKDTRNVEGVVVTLATKNKLKLLSSRHGWLHKEAWATNADVWQERSTVPSPSATLLPKHPKELVHASVHLEEPAQALLEGCSQSVVELQRQDLGWGFQNPSLGVLEYRVLGTNFRDYAVVFTQLEFGDEAFNTVELYSRTETASEEAMRLFTKWSRGLGFWSQQQAQLQRDFTCAHRILQ